MTLFIALFDLVWFTVVFTVWSWCAYCLHKAHQQRMQIIMVLPWRPLTGPALLKALGAVPFTRHINAVILFRDPWALYDPMVHDAVVNPRTETFQGIFTVEGVELVEGPPQRMN